MLECYPSGSFATGTAVASRVSRNQHDVDVAIELDIDPATPPAVVLNSLFLAIQGEPGSLYYGRVTRNSRCVTVRYDDGTTVDLMPVARLAGEPERAAHLFHWKPEGRIEYHKVVNPWAFAEHFNQRVEVMEEFQKAFAARRLLVEGELLEKADALPMPDHVPLEEKSPRVVALQLMKRFRDVRYRGRPGRKPPSIVMAALALEIGPTRAGLADELAALADHVLRQIRAASARGVRLHVENPAYRPDVFTDRWPETIPAQERFALDLRELSRALERLRSRILAPEDALADLKELFGETAARHAVESFLDVRRAEAAAGRLSVGPRGRLLAAAPAVLTPAGARAQHAPARRSTFHGGTRFPE